VSSAQAKRVGWLQAGIRIQMSRLTRMATPIGAATHLSGDVRDLPAGLSIRLNWPIIPADFRVIQRTRG
jgi:hypothetical protein